MTYQEIFESYVMLLPWAMRGAARDPGSTLHSVFTAIALRELKLRGDVEELVGKNFK